MTKAIRKRLIALERRIPSPRMDLRDVSDRDLVALERHFEHIVAGEGGLEKLPVRLQRILAAHGA